MTSKSYGMAHNGSYLDEKCPQCGLSLIVVEKYATGVRYIAQDSVGRPVPAEVYGRIGKCEDCGSIHTELDGVVERGLGLMSVSGLTKSQLAGAQAALHIRAAGIVAAQGDKKAARSQLECAFLAVLQIDGNEDEFYLEQIRHTESRYGITIADSIPEDAELQDIERGNEEEEDDDDEDQEDEDVTTEEHDAEDILEIINETLAEWLPTVEPKLHLASSLASEQAKEGEAAYRNGDLLKAVVAFCKGIAIIEKSGDPFEVKDLYYLVYNRGVVFADLGDFENAIADFSRAILLFDYDPDAYNEGANAYLQIRDKSSAIADLEMAIEIHEDKNPKYRKKLENIRRVGIRRQ